jgi:hypothetical protein
MTKKNRNTDVEIITKESINKSRSENDNDFYGFE